MVTINPARAFRMQRDIGSLAEGKLADLLVMRQTRDDPYESLVDLHPENIELLLLEGTPIFGSKAHEELFVSRGVPCTAVRIRGREMLVKGDPAALMERVRSAVGFRKVLDFMPLDT
jgi:hypothetical protein